MLDIELKDVAQSFEALNRGFEEFKATNDQRLQDLEEKGSADPLTEEKLAKIDDFMTKSQEQLDKLELTLKRPETKYLDADGNEIDMEAKALDWQRTFRGKAANLDAEGLLAYQGVLGKYYRKHELGMSADEVKALSVGSDPDGGYTVHPDMNGRVVSKVFETSPMRAYASVTTIGTDALEGMYDLDEAGSGWVEETEARPETTTPQMEKYRIPVHTLFANPRVTQKILDDSSINIEQYLADKISRKFGRDEATAFVTGTGVTRPRGFLDYPDGTTLPGTIERFTTGVNGGFAAAPNGGDALIDALYGLKAEYRANATWFFNRSTTGALRKLKDSDGSYLWTPGIQAGQPATLLGYPTASFEDMPDIATGSLSIAVGDMRSAYQIVDRIGIRTLRDPYSSKPYVQFYTTKRVGGDVIDFDALKIVEFSA